ncbi:MAG: hexapeptide transferase [Chitinophagaceae bacterium]|nr:hexapeptide transferase [Chitinophagaceae bacterium]
MINRIIYLGYYFLKTPKKQFYKNFNFVKEKKKISSFSLYKDVLFSSLKYNISLMDYFKLRFFDKTKQERSEYAGAGFMYKYQLDMNPKESRDILENKVKFLEYFKDFAGRKWATIEMLESNKNLAADFLKSEQGKIVLKNSKGQAGKEVAVVDTKNMNVDDLFALMKKNNFDLIESFVVQHDELMKIAPRGLNTARIITQYHNNKIIIIGTSLRLSVHLNIDNISAGNFAVPVDPETGIVTDPGIYTDVTKEDVYKHPLTGIDIIGFKVPFWKECIETTTKAALLTPQNRSIGWDVAITNAGPLLIEGNHNWNNDLWQMPVRKGLKKILLQFVEN